MDKCMNRKLLGEEIEITKNILKDTILSWNANESLKYSYCSSDVQKKCFFILKYDLLFL